MLKKIKVSSTYKSWSKSTLKKLTHKKLTLLTMKLFMNLLEQFKIQGKSRILNLCHNKFIMLSTSSTNFQPHQKIFVKFKRVWKEIPPGSFLGTFESWISILEAWCHSNNFFLGEFEKINRVVWLSFKKVLWDCFCSIASKVLFRSAKYDGF